MTFSREFPIRFGAVDQARVIYYPRYFDLFHRTFEDWFSDALGRSYPDLVLEDNLGFPTVRVETEFVAPLRYGDRVRIDLDLAEVGRRSLVVKYTAFRLPGLDVTARATITKALVDNDRFVSVSIPDEWRRRFEAFKERP